MKILRLNVLKSPDPLKLLRYEIYYIYRICICIFLYYIFDIFNSALTVYSHFFAKTLLKYVFSCSKNIVNVFYFLFVLQTAERQGSVPS